MSRVPKIASWRCEVLGSLIIVFSLLAWPQTFTKSDRDHAQAMLRDVAGDVQKHYYDAHLHGVDWDAKVRAAKENIDKADTMDNAISEIAALLDTLNDSHTRFFPPPRAYIHDYGLKMQMVGDRCYVIHVTPDSDAEKQGIKPGNEILAINQHRVSRKTFPRIAYIYDTLRPLQVMQLNLVDASGQSHQIDVTAKTRPSSVLNYALHNGINQKARDYAKQGILLRARYFEKGNGLLIVRIPEFDFSAEEVDNIIGKMRKHKGVVLDLRGNPGGFVSTLDRLLGGMFQDDLKIYDSIGRKTNKTVAVTGRHHDAFTGRFAVLVDSNSASASELFARVVQLEKRGFILGDRSSGSVMEAMVYRHEWYLDAGVYYGANITEADLLMADGKSLEHVGVDPDIMILPTAQDLSSGRDPVMAKAAGLLGSEISPEEAGTLFPYEDPTVY
jgi:carboxyl-terminal processing protease